MVPEQLRSPSFLPQGLTCVSPVPASSLGSRTESVNSWMPVRDFYFQQESTRVYFCCLQTRALVSTDIGAMAGAGRSPEGFWGIWDWLLP